MMRFDELFADVADGALLVKHGALELRGLFDDSRRVERDGVFVAVRGVATDGAQFVSDALAKGARVVVGEDLGAAPDGAIFVNVDDARLALARLAGRWFGLDRPGFRLKLAGVTGTNGKSTTAVMTRAILAEAGLKCGLLGTMHYDLCARTMTARLTTPGTLELASYLRECADAGADAAVMEVSSHALSQHRTAGLRFDAAAFTNLTQDHLDYHGTLDAYFEAKRRLFMTLGSEAVAVVNRDDPRWEDVARDCPGKVVYYSLDHDADIRGKIVQNTIKGTLYRITFEGQTVALENAIVGKHNVYNALAATGLALALGASPANVEAGLASVRNIPGRLQRVPCMTKAEVFVDYAHTDDALRNVASVLKPLARGRLIVVFGCGGDRDRGKRPKMAQAAAEFGDAVVVTSDNPRTEDPVRIIDDIMAGFDAAALRRVSKEPDRRAAITCALAGAAEGDVVLIAGKGHEDYQIIGDQRIHFDDVEVAIEAAAQLAGGASDVDTTTRAAQ